jgi:hypothetical protein
MHIFNEEKKITHLVTIPLKELGRPTPTLFFIQAVLPLKISFLLISIP